MATYISEEKIRRRDVALYKQENVSISTSSVVEASVSGTESVRKSSRAFFKFDKEKYCLICDEVTKNKNKNYMCSEISAAEQILNTARKKIRWCLHKN